MNDQLQMLRIIARLQARCLQDPNFHREGFNWNPWEVVGELILNHAVSIDSPYMTSTIE